MAVSKEFDSSKTFILKKSLSPDPETGGHMIMFQDEVLDYDGLTDERFEDLDELTDLGELGSEIAAMAGFAGRFHFPTNQDSLGSVLDLNEEKIKEIAQEYEKDKLIRRKDKLN